MRTWRTESAAQTRDLGERLAHELVPGGILLLSGALGAGKTTLVQGVAAGLGLDPKEIQSPSYTLVREHAGPRGRLVHIDLYRLGSREADALGLDEILDGPGVKAVEWPDRLRFPVPGGLHLELRLLAGGERRIDEVEPAVTGAKELNDMVAEVR
ncbi:MAG: tRNA (adenosine(37)-N6)-threonylcarbamoyltransferase complex ATPase subunit type 1 TsaE [Thermoanaerobaculia bacterium]